jgi:hypothetical protein
VWAAPEIDAGARERALADWVRAAAAAARLPGPPAAAGLYGDGDGSFELRPPMPAARLAAVLGAPGAFARTVDVHMSHWQLAGPDGDLRIGPWKVEATIDGRPAGGPVPGVSLPAALARELAGGELVSRVHLRPG